jgi:hypothetical protein
MRGIIYKVNPWDSVHQGIGYVAAYAAKHLPLEECRVLGHTGRQIRKGVTFLTIIET